MITWNYSVADSAVEYLAAGQTKVETFTITLDDGNGGAVTRTINVTITGTNDAPVVAAHGCDRRGDRAGHPGRQPDRQRHHRLHRRRPHRRAQHQPAVTASAGALGTLTASVTTDTTGTGMGGVITWNYRSRTRRLSIWRPARPRSRPSPSRSTTATAAVDPTHVSVTITGTNDAPVVAAHGRDRRGDRADHPGWQPDRQRHHRLHRRRPHRRAQHQPATPPSGALGTLTASVTTDTTGTGTGGVVTWNYSVAD